MKEKITKIFILIIVLVVAFLTGYYYKTYQIENQLFQLETGEVKGTPGFLMTNNLSCQILYSTNKEDIGKSISLLNLFSDSPGFLSYRGGTSPIQKVYETNDQLTMLLVASGSGSIDAFVLNKKTGEFSRVSAGSLAGVYAVASKGNCK